MTPDAAQDLIDRAAQECEGRNEYVLPVHLDLSAAVAVIGCLQLALRHPENRGSASNIVREVIDAMIARLKTDGFSAYAQVAELGDDPRYDT